MNTFTGHIPYEGIVSAKEVIAKKPPKMEWISVDDRLPKISGYYLISNGVYVKRGEYNTLYKEWFDVTEISGVTHWMPLPEAPK